MSYQPLEFSFKKNDSLDFIQLYDFGTSSIIYPSTENAINIAGKSNTAVSQFFRLQNRL